MNQLDTVIHLASRSFDLSEIALAIDSSPDLVLARYGDIIAAVQPSFVEYANQRASRLLRVASSRDDKDFIHFAKSRLLGRKYYPLSLENRIVCAVRSHIAEMCKRNGVVFRGGRSVIESAVGYSIPEMMSHIEALFVSGMNWANWGQWHIDHIIPRSSFRFHSIDDESFRFCWSLENLRPLWALDNLRKGCRLEN